MENGPPAFEKTPETPTEKLQFAAEQQIEALSSGLRVVGSRLALAREQVAKLEEHERRLELRRKALQVFVSSCSLDVNLGWVEQELSSLQKKIGVEDGTVPF